MLRLFTQLMIRISQNSPNEGLLYKHYVEAEYNQGN